MNIKNKILVLIFMLFATSMFYGQRRSGERIKALKIAFITERLELNAQEAQVFWPIYNAYADKIEAFRKKERSQIRTKLRNMDDLSEKEVKVLLDQTIALQHERHKENMSFIEKMGNVISAKKAFMLIKAEEDFKKRLLQQIKKRRQEGGE